MCLEICYFEFVLLSDFTQLYFFLQNLLRVPIYELQFHLISLFNTNYHALPSFQCYRVSHVEIWLSSVRISFFDFKSISRKYMQALPLFDHAYIILHKLYFYVFHQVFEMYNLMFSPSFPPLSQQTERKRWRNY